MRKQALTQRTVRTSQVASLKRQVEPFKRKVEVSEAEKRRTEEFRARDVSNLQNLLANEREERAREAVSYQKRLDDTNELLRSAREAMGEMRTGHVKELHRLEKGMVAATQAIFGGIRGKGKGKKAAGGEKKREGDEENVKAGGN